MILLRSSNNSMRSPLAETVSNEEIFTEILRRIDSDSIGERGLSWLPLLGQALKLTQEDQRILSVPFQVAHQAVSRHLDGEELKYIAEQADLRDDIPKALASYFRYLSVNPKNGDIRLALGRLLIDRGDINGAQQIYCQGTDTDEDPAMRSLHAEILLAQCQYEAAYQQARFAVEIDPYHIEALVTAAMTCHWTGRETKEERLLAQALSICPDHPLVIARWCDRANPKLTPRQRLHLLREYGGGERETRSRSLQLAWVNTLLLNHQFERALTEAQALRRRHPQSISARLALASAHFHLAELQTAHQLVVEIIEKHPHSVTAFAIYIACLHAQGETYETIDPILQRLTVLSEGSPRASLWTAQFLELSGAEGRALSLRRSLKKQFPKHLPILLSLGEQLMRLDDRQEGDVIIQKLMTEHPDFLDTYLVDAQRLLREERWGEVRRVIKLCADLPSVRELELRWLIATGNYREAITLGNHLCALNPANAALIEYVINALWQEEQDVAEHLIRLEEGLTSAVRRPHLLLLLSYLWLHLDDEQRARTLLNEAITQDLGSLYGQRLIFACEVAYQLRERETLNTLIAHARSPLPTSAFFYAGVCAWHLGEYHEALEYGLQMVDVSEVHLQAEQLIVITIWACELKKYEDAFRVVQLLSKHEGCPEEELIALQVRVGLNQEQEDVFNQAVQLGQSWLEDLHTPNACLFLLEWALESVQLDPETRQDQVADSVIGTTVSSLEWERLNAALLWGCWGIEQFPNDSELWRRLALIYSLLGQDRAASFAQERAIELHPIPTDWLSLGHLLERTGDFASARRAFQRALAINKDQGEHAQLLLEWGGHLLRSGDEAGAKKAIDDLLAFADRGIMDTSTPVGLQVETDKGDTPLEDPVEELVAIWLSQCLQHSSMRYVLTTAELLYSRYGYPFIQGYIGIAECCFGRYMVALPALEEGYHVDPQFGGELAHCLWRSGDRRRALSIMGDTVEHYPEDMNLLVQLIGLLTEEGEAALAHQYLLTLISSSPEFEGIPELMERVHTLLELH